MRFMKKYRYPLLFLAACLLLAVLLLLFHSGQWLMSEEEILAYYRETYGQEMRILSRTAEEYQEGDTHTRQQKLTLCPADQPDLQFRFSEWAGYAYSPGPIPQLWPSFSRSFLDRYPSDALVYALREFAGVQGLGSLEGTEDDYTVTITAADWEGAVRRIVGFTNSLRDVSPYDHIENIWLLTFRRVQEGQPDAMFRANLFFDNGLCADPEEIIQGVRIAGNRARTSEQFIGDFQAFLADSGLSYRAEPGYNEWVFCQSLTVSIDVGSLTELDGILELLAAFVEPIQKQDVYTGEGLPRVPVTVHFVQRGVPEPKGQIADWDPFSSGSLSIDTEAIRKHIVKLDLLPEEPPAGTGTQEPEEPSAGTRTQEPGVFL